MTRNAEELKAQILAVFNNAAETYNKLVPFFSEAARRLGCPSSRARLQDPR